MNTMLESAVAQRVPAVAASRVLLSSLIGTKVTSVDGSTLGNLQDVVVRLPASGEPPLRGLLIDTDDDCAFISAADLSQLDPPTTLHRVEVQNFERQPGDLLLSRELLDRWIVDLPRWRVVRGSDAVLSPQHGGYRLDAIDVSADGTARRLGPRWLVRLLKGDFVAWTDLEVLVSLASVVGSPRELGRLVERHPAELARLVEQFRDAEGAALFDAFDDALAAAVLEEIDDERQAALLKSLPLARAVQILRSMQPDAAADVLDDLGRREADGYLSGMDQSQAGFIREALDYPKDSAGGVINTDFAMAFSGQSVREVVAILRASGTRRGLEDWHVFVVGDKRQPRLIGIVSPLDLLTAEPDALLAGVMHTRIRHVEPEASARTAAGLMADYNLMVLPVIDRSGEMLGVITADDALDVLLSGDDNRH